MERVMAATTLPTLLLGGDPDGDPDETYAAWQAASPLPSVRGLVVGRTMLYPADDDVAKAVDTAVSWCAEEPVDDVRAVPARRRRPPTDPYDLVVTPTSAGWGYSSLRVLTLTGRRGARFACDGEEIIVVPLSGGAVGDQSAGRPSSWPGGPTCSPVRPTSSTCRPARPPRSPPTDGGRYALCGARERRRPAGPLRLRRPRSRWSCAGRGSPAARCATSARRRRWPPARSSPAR